MSENTSPGTLHHISEDLILNQQHCCENLK